MPATKLHTIESDEGRERLGHLRAASRTASVFFKELGRALDMPSGDACGPSYPQQREHM